MGDEYQSKAVSGLAGILTGKAINPRYWQRMRAHATHQARLALSATRPKSASMYLRQARNTRHIFTLVRNNANILGIPDEGEFDLGSFLKKAYDVGDFESIWTDEGLGHVYAQRTRDLRA